MACSTGWTNQILVIVFAVLTAAVTSADDAERTQANLTTTAQTNIEEDHYPYRKEEEELIEQCHQYAQTLMAEKERLRAELDAIKARIEAQALQHMEQEEQHSNESHSRSRGIRRTRSGRSGRRRRANSCDGGTVSQWACGSQCIFKLKGLCGLSLRSMCHC